MAKYLMDFQLSAWIKFLEIEADSADDAKLKLQSMPIKDIIEKGDIRDYAYEFVDATRDWSAEDDK